jgi:neuroblastoma-amplified sequence
LRSSLSTEDIEKRVNELGILPDLISDESSPTTTSSFVARMHTRVYPLINGTDHNRLLYYYTLLSNCSPGDDAAITPKTHVLLLKKLKTAAPGNLLFELLFLLGKL